MQTTYLILKNLGSNPFQKNIEVPKRIKWEFNIGDFTVFLFVPDHPDLIKMTEDRIHQTDTEFYFEDGFMLRYPEPYEPKAALKLSHFELPSIKLDGAFSRLVIKNNTLTIDGSALYLQMLFSHECEEFIAFSNNITVLEGFLKENDVQLTVNNDFFAAHLYNYSLAYYTFAGTLWNEVAFHDSTDTITISDSISSVVENKLVDSEFSALERNQRIDLLYERLQHAVNEYCNYINVKTLGHNLTSGRDSRTSFLLFMKNNKDRLMIETFGFTYLPDRVVANLVSREYGINFNFTDQYSTPQNFNYTDRMDMKNSEEVFIPLFRKIAVEYGFNRDKFIASGYLGNVLTFGGAERNQIMRDNPYGLEPEVSERLAAIYDKNIAELEHAYGEYAYSLFNIKFNTTNKISSVLRRMKMFTFCIFECDIFQAAYFLEDAKSKSLNSLHYELMKRADNDFLNLVPFESNKSFSEYDTTYEVQMFREQGNPRIYKKFIENNFEKIYDHIKENLGNIPHLTQAFLDKLEPFRGKEIPPQFIHKIYGVLGYLEFSGKTFTQFNEASLEQLSELYTTEFFERLYVENQRFVSGLSGMCYTSDIVFRSYIKLLEHENLQVTFVHRRTNERPPVEISEQEDGYTIRTKIVTPGKYNVFLFARDIPAKTRRELFRTNIVVKPLDLDTEET